MSFGSRLRDKRNELNITQPQLAKLLGVSQSAVGSWETDVNSPRATLLYDLFEILHCDANYLFQDETKELYKNEATPEEFEKIIKKYRELDPHGKEMVDFTLLKEWERSTAEKTNVVPLYIKEDTPDYLKPQAAHNDDESEEELSLMKEDVSSLKKPQL